MEEKRYDYVIFQKDGKIARIILNNPPLNLLNMMGTTVGARSDMLRALTEAEDDDDINVIVIKGAGKCFTAGLDLKQAGFVYGIGTGKEGERRPSQRIRLRYDRQFMDDFMRILYSPKIIITIISSIKV